MFPTFHYIYILKISYLPHVRVNLKLRFSSPDCKCWLRYKADDDDDYDDDGLFLWYG